MSPFGVVDPVQVSDLGVITLEDGGVWLRRGGRRVEIALPPGANPELVAVAGTVGVAPVPEGALVVFDLRSGVELRQVSLGEYDPVNLDGLAVSQSGEVAATVPAGDGTGVLVWEVVPRITVGGIVFSYGAPLALAEVVTPAPPLHAVARLLEAAVLSREDGGRPRRSLRRTVQ